MTKDFDSVGIVVTKLSNGRYATQRVFLNRGKVVELETIRNDQALVAAYREAHPEFDITQSRMSKRQYIFRDFPSPKFKVE